MIETLNFNSILIESLSIPASVCEFEDGWCSCAENLTKVTIDHRNQYFMICTEDERLVIDKSELTNYIFDVLLFASCDITDVTIPSYIKRIGSFAFEYCSFEKFLSSSTNRTN